ncbi:MAG: DUF3794 domain-containing protein [Mycobacterium leprae]
MPRSVVGFGTQEHLLVSRIPLPRPATRLLLTTKSILVDDSTVLYDGVILTGRLRVGCLVPLAADPHPVEQVDTEQTFTLFLPVPGAAPEMDVRLLAAHVAGGETTAAQQNAAGEIVALLDRSLLHLSVIVTTPTPDVTPAPLRWRRRAERTTPAPSLQASACRFRG